MMKENEQERNLKVLSKINMRFDYETVYCYNNVYQSVFWGH